MGRDVVSAKLDVIFKKLFTENEDLLHSFVASMLDIPTDSIKTIKISNPELPPETVESKFSRLDLSLNVDDKLVNVEIQVKMEPDYRDRTLFYWAKLYTSELKSGEEYGNLKQTITINIINFNMFECQNYHTEVAAMIKGTNEEPEPEQPEKKSSGGLLVIVLLLALAGGGAFAYVKFIKPKQGMKVSTDPDDYDFEDEEMVNEDDIV